MNPRHALCVLACFFFHAPSADAHKTLRLGHTRCRLRRAAAAPTPMTCSGAPAPCVQRGAQSLAVDLRPCEWLGCTTCRISWLPFADYSSIWAAGSRHLFPFYSRCLSFLPIPFDPSRFPSLPISAVPSPPADSFHPIPYPTMAEAIHSATVGVVDKIAAVTTGIADKVGATTPSSQTSLAPHPPAPAAEHTNPPAPTHLPPGGTLPAAHPPPLPEGAQAVITGDKAGTPVGAGAAVPQPIAAASVEGGSDGAAAGTAAPAAVAERPVVPVATAVAVPVTVAPTEAVASSPQPAAVAATPYVLGKGSDVVEDADNNSNQVLTVE